MLESKGDPLNTGVTEKGEAAGKFYGVLLETVSDFIFLGSKITADGDCSHEIKRHLLLGRKVMTNLDSMTLSWVGSPVVAPST